MSIKIHWIPQRLAREFIAEHHRRLPSIQGSIFQLGMFADGELIAVVVCGRPIASHLNFYEILEVTRFGTIPNRHYAISRLFSRVCTIAKGLGFQTVQTYIDESETGVSLRASSLKLVARKVGISQNKQLWKRDL